MKKVLLKFLVACVSAIIFLYSCTKTDEPIYEDCQLTRTVTPGDTSNFSTRYYYDANGLLTQIMATNYQIDISYNGNKVIKQKLVTRLNTRLDRIQRPFPPPIFPPLQVNRYIAGYTPTTRINI